MKVRYLRHKDIDRQRWDMCISQSVKPLVYALSWYLDITSPGWDALVGGDYETVMPLTWRKKYGLKYLIQPYYSQQLGIFGNVVGAEIVREFFDAIPSRFVVVKINGNATNDFSPSPHRIKQNRNYEIDLSTDYDTAASGFSRNNRKNIRIAGRKHLTLKPEIDQNPFVNFYLEFIGERISDLPNRPFEIFRNIVALAGKQALTSTYGVYDKDEKLCSGALFLHSFNRRILIASASNHSGRQNRAMYFLLDNFIKMHAGLPLVLDFEGSNIEGIASFYDGFGANCMNYPSVSFINVSYKTISRQKKKKIEN